MFNRLLIILSVAFLSQSWAPPARKDLVRENGEWMYYGGPDTVPVKAVIGRRYETYEGIRSISDSTFETFNSDELNLVRENGKWMYYGGPGTVPVKAVIGRRYDCGKYDFSEETKFKSIGDDGIFNPDELNLVRENGEWMYYGGPGIVPVKAVIGRRYDCGKWFSGKTKFKSIGDDGIFNPDELNLVRENGELMYYGGPGTVPVKAVIGRRYDCGKAWFLGETKFKSIGDDGIFNPDELNLVRENGELMYYGGPGTVPVKAVIGRRYRTYEGIRSVSDDGIFNPDGANFVREHGKWMYYDGRGNSERAQPGCTYSYFKDDEDKRMLRETIAEVQPDGSISFSKRPLLLYCIQGIQAVREERRRREAADFCALL